MTKISWWQEIDLIRRILIRCWLIITTRILHCAAQVHGSGLVVEVAAMGAPDYKQCMWLYSNSHQSRCSSNALSCTCDEHDFTSESSWWTGHCSCSRFLRGAWLTKVTCTNSTMPAPGDGHACAHLASMWIEGPALYLSRQGQNSVQCSAIETQKLH